MKYIIALFVICLSSIATFAQEASAPANFVEVRGSSTQYYYADWMHTFSNKVAGKPVVSDITYIKTPGSSELNAGVGLQFGPVTPLVYAVVDAQNHQAGVKAAVLVTYQKKKLKVNAFAAHNFNFRGDDYDVIDTLDATWAFGKFDAGFSMGLFHQGNFTDVTRGGVVKFNHKNSSLSLSVRTTSSGSIETRGGLTVTF